MIEVTRLDGAKIVVNSDLIELIEATPDTIVSLTNGRKIVIRESVAEVVESVIRFKRRVKFGVSRAKGSTKDAKE